MFSPQMRQFLQWQRLATGLAGLSFGLLVSVFSNWLSAEWAGWLPWVMGIMILTGLASLVLALRKPPGLGVAIRSPRTIRSPQEARRYARRGFIGFVPLYTPQPGTPAAALAGPERLAAVRALQFERLNLEESNLRPTIEAITSHASALEHCWLLSTQANDGSGSILYAHLLAEYLQRCQGLKCQFGSC